MKILFLAVIFLGVPFFLLSNVVMPQINELKHFYQNIEEIAENNIQ